MILVLSDHRRSGRPDHEGSTADQPPSTTRFAVVSRWFLRCELASLEGFGPGGPHASTIDRWLRCEERQRRASKPPSGRRQLVEAVLDPVRGVRADVRQVVETDVLGRTLLGREDAQLGGRRGRRGRTTSASRRDPLGRTGSVPGPSSSASARPGRRRPPTGSTSAPPSADGSPLRPGPPALPAGPRPPSRPASGPASQRPPWPLRHGSAGRRGPPRRSLPRC